MDLQLDPASPVPLFRQLVEGVRRLVAIGVLKSGDRLPPVRDLAARLRLNRNTVSRAFQELEALGLVRSRVGQGTFVAAEAAGSATREALLEGAIDALLDAARDLEVPLDALSARVEDRIRRREERR